MNSDESDEQQDYSDEKEGLIRNGAAPNGAVNIPSPVGESPAEYRSRWISIRILYLTMFLGSVGFSIGISSMYPYLRTIDKEATQDFFGWVVAAFSFGQLVASPFFGMWSNVRKRTKEPLVVALVIATLANLMYAYLESFPDDGYRRWLMLVSRIFTGIGAGSIAVARGYVAGATTLTERTGVLSAMSAFQSIGYIIGPAIQSAVVPIGYPGPADSVAFHFNLYTFPGFLSAFASIVNVILLLLVFREHQVVQNSSGTVTSSMSASMSQSVAVVAPLDMVPVVICNVVFYILLFQFTLFETISTPMSMDMYDWTKSEATLYVGLQMALGSLICITVFFVINKFLRKYSERKLLLIGFVISFFGYVIMLPWGNDYPDYQDSDLQPVTYAPNTTHMIPNTTHVTPNMTDYTTAAANGSLSTLLSTIITEVMESAVTYETTSAVPKRGCRPEITWCHEVPRIQLGQYIAGNAVISVGYPLSFVMIFTLYSKILGPRPQGTMMGWFTASGSLARALGPIAVSYVYVYYGPRVTFIGTLGIVLAAITLSAAFYKRMVPYKAQPPSSYGAIN